MLIDLEEIVERKNYKLKCDWSCNDCGEKTEIYGKLLPTDPAYNDKQVTWNDIIKKRCKKGHLNTPIRKCTRCNKKAEFDESMCGNCDKVIEEMLTMEEEYNELNILLRKGKRKKEDVRAYELRLAELKNRLGYIGYQPCGKCGKVMTEKQICHECENG